MRAVAIALALAACGGASGARETQPDDEVWLSPQQMAKAAIRVAEAQAKPIAQAINVAGRIAFDDLHATHVFSPVTGRVTRVLAKPGDRVVKGAPLVAILSPDVGTAFSDTVKAQADLQASQLDYEREQRLLREDATSQRSFEAAQDAYRRATAEYERAKQRASLLRSGGAGSVTQEYILRSFINGEVIARSVSPGVEVAGQYSGGNAIELFTVGDIKRVWVYADIQDVDAPKVHASDAVEIRVVAYPGRVFHGTIDLVASTVDPVLRTVRVRCSLANDGEELKPEMFATVSIVQPAQNVVAVPHDGVVAINEATYVYVESGMRPTAGSCSSAGWSPRATSATGSIPIVNGVAAGDRVVVEGSVSPEQPNDEVWPTQKQIEEGHITTAKVAREDIDDAVSIGARLAFDDTSISHVFSPVNGRITRVLAQPGQHVTKGTPLVAIDVARSRQLPRRRREGGRRPHAGGARVPAPERALRRGRRRQARPRGGRRRAPQGRGRAPAREAAHRAARAAGLRHGHAGVPAAQPDRRRGDLTPRDAGPRGAGSVRERRLVEQRRRAVHDRRCSASCGCSATSTSSTCRASTKATSVTIRVSAYPGKRHPRPRRLGRRRRSIPCSTRRRSAASSTTPIACSSRRCTSASTSGAGQGHGRRAARGADARRRRDVVFVQTGERKPDGGVVFKRRR